MVNPFEVTAAEAAHSKTRFQKIQDRTANGLAPGEQVFISIAKNKNNNLNNPNVANGEDIQNNNEVNEIAPENTKPYNLIGNAKLLIDFTILGNSMVKDV